MSQVTTHTLDTTRGKPAKDVAITLYRGDNDQWIELAKGVTNKDGRIPDFLNKDVVLETGFYKMRFETRSYFEKDGIASFYPYVEIIFDITTKEHYHIPLLLSPFGYSTYRGS